MFIFAMHSRSRSRKFEMASGPLTGWPPALSTQFSHALMNITCQLKMFKSTEIAIAISIGIAIARYNETTAFSMDAAFILMLIVVLLRNKSQTLYGNFLLCNLFSKCNEFFMLLLWFGKQLIGRTVVKCILFCLSTGKKVLWLL